MKKVDRIEVGKVHNPTSSFDVYFVVHVDLYLVIVRNLKDRICDEVDGVVDYVDIILVLDSVANKDDIFTMRISFQPNNSKTMVSIINIVFDYLIGEVIDDLLINIRPNYQIHILDFIFSNIDDNSYGRTNIGINNFTKVAKHFYIDNLLNVLFLDVINIHSSVFQEGLQGIVNQEIVSVDNINFFIGVKGAICNAIYNNISFYNDYQV